MKPKKSDLIPFYNNPARTILMSLLFTHEEYLRNIEKGYPFFKEDELTQIEKNHTKGMTWKEIDNELSKKGIILKKPTFRKYLQDKLLPPAVKETEKSIKGKELYYPSEIVGHINFVKYFFFSDQHQLSKIYESLKKIKDIKLPIIDSIEEYSGPIKLSIMNYLYPGSELDGAISEHFKLYPDRKLEEKVWAKLENIQSNFSEYVEQEIDRLICLLQSSKYTLKVDFSDDINS